MTAGQRSVKRLRELGYTVQLVERFNKFGNKAWKVDLFGFADYLAIKPGQSVLAVQCVNTHIQEHIVKVCEEPLAKIWLQTGSRIVIHSWVERGPKGAKVWELDLTRVELVKNEVVALPF